MAVRMLHRKDFAVEIHFSFHSHESTVDDSSIIQSNSVNQHKFDIRKVDALL